MPASECVYVQSIQSLRSSLLDSLGIIEYINEKSPINGSDAYRVLGLR